ncbi:uncharacterized protein [Anabrus simplex]|uniref:uncharacterized protein n=1 Tax=Anabrus simplex TaxID=316456 RepID=UPI0035A34DC7
MQKKRTANFREDETKLLIQLWGSPEIQSQLNSSHRKAPIMLQIAAAMQHHGFYRTPEEITTRIRNLKCIYHRIKKSQHMGIFGPETADWHHFPAIDAILGENFASTVETHGDQYSKFIKKESNDSETVDSVYNSNSACSGLEDDSNSGATSPVPSPLQRFTMGSSQWMDPNTLLERARHLEVNGRHEKEQNLEAINYSTHSKRYRVQEQYEDDVESKRRLQSTQHDSDVSSLLSQLLDVEREHLELEKQRLELDRQVGSQLLTLVPLVSNIFQKHQLQKETDHGDRPEPSQSVVESNSDLVNKLFQTIPYPEK